MKTNILPAVLALFMLSATAVFVSCDRDDNDNTYTISGNANGAQENPPVTTTGTATLAGSYDRNSNVLNYSISFSGLTGPVTAAHFHGPAVQGQNASPIHDITITSNGTSGTASGTITIAEATESELLNGRIYYNLHTALYPNGEIRGQVAAVSND